MVMTKIMPLAGHLADQQHRLPLIPASWQQAQTQVGQSASPPPFVASWGLNLPMAGVPAVGLWLLRLLWIKQGRSPAMLRMVR